MRYAKDAAGVDEALGEDGADGSGDFALRRHKERSSRKSNASKEHKDCREALEVEAAEVVLL